jgi:hypothetical protein
MIIHVHLFVIIHNISYIKFTLDQAMMAQMVNRGIALLFL